MRLSLLTLFLSCILFFSAMLAPAGTCNNAYISEGQFPSAIEGIKTTDQGFISYVWAWGANSSDQGSAMVGLSNDDTGIAINPGFLFSNSDACTGSINGIGLLVQAQTASNGGVFALVSLDSAEGQIDRIQESQSIGQPIPVPALRLADCGTDSFGEYVDYRLSWSQPSSSAWGVSNNSPILAGYSVFYNTNTSGGPVNNGDPTLFDRIGATASGSLPFITNDPDTQDGLIPSTQTECFVRVRKEAGIIYYFALSVLLDGTGAVGTDPQADLSAVETSYVGASSIGGTTDTELFSDDFETGDTSAWSSIIG